MSNSLQGLGEHISSHVGGGNILERQNLVLHNSVTKPPVLDSYVAHFAVEFRVLPNADGSLVVHVHGSGVALFESKFRHEVSMPNRIVTSLISRNKFGFSGRLGDGGLTMRSPVDKAGSNERRISACGTSGVQVTSVLQVGYGIGLGTEPEHLGTSLGRELESTEIEEVLY